MSKIASYLQEHLSGEVMTGVDARRYFATDNSMLNLPPAAVIYPRNEHDVRKAARFTWQLAERGRVVPITARGSGTDQSGASLTDGLAVVFPAHQNRILELDSKSGTVTVEPGINFGKLQQTLQTHGRWLPVAPASAEYSSVGGAVANNSAGMYSLKYGDMGAYVRGLRVVLANGEVINTERLNKRELNKKLGLATFEGEIYRQIDTLLEENKELIAGLERATTRNSAGYNLLDIRRKDGSFDLSPLFVGSQGTLGIITEVVLNTESHEPGSTLFMAGFDSPQAAQNAIQELRAQSTMPAAIEFVDKHLLTQVQTANPNVLGGIVQPPFPAILLLVEYDNADTHLKRSLKHAQKILEKYSLHVVSETETAKQDQFWKLRHASTWLLTQNDGPRRALPLFGSAIVPPENWSKLLQGVYDIFARAKLPVGAWGHAGDGQVSVAPLLDLSQVGDRQIAFRMLDEYVKLVIALGGSTSGDGRLHAPYLERVYGTEAYNVLRKVKQIFDPYGTLNPGVKIGVSMDDVKPLLRSTFNLEHLYDHLPRS